MDFLNSIKQIQQVFERKNYTFFDRMLPYNLNLFGIRSSNSKPNKFDDLIIVVYRNENLDWKIENYEATTDPGRYWMTNPMNVKGTAILVEGQYRGAFGLGLHKGYPALIQKKALKVYRERNRDENFDFDKETIEEGFFGINIHRASKLYITNEVEKWSAGCQVIKSYEQYRDMFLPVLMQQNIKHGNSFTYTLFNEKDFLEI